MLSIQEHLIGANDKYAPLLPKPTLQKYDNYQTYDIYSTDSNAVITENSNQPYAVSSQLGNLVAVEVYSPQGKARLDFKLIAEMYS